MPRDQKAQTKTLPQSLDSGIQFYHLQGVWAPHPGLVACLHVPRVYRALPHTSCHLPFVTTK